MNSAFHQVNSVYSVYSVVNIKPAEGIPRNFADESGRKREIKH